MALTESKSKVKLKNKSQLNHSINKNIDCNDLIDNKSATNWWIIFILIVIISFATRLYKISEPNHVWFVLITKLYYLLVMY